MVDACSTPSAARRRTDEPENDVKAYETISVDRAEAVVRVTFNRPDVRNALDARMIAELTDCFTELAGDRGARVVILAGNGAAFSGGADVNYMRAGLDLGEAENEADALRLA